MATKAIASRLKTLLPKLISNDQTGFIKDRFIGENIRSIDSIIKYTAAKRIPGVLLFLDFEKAASLIHWNGPSLFIKPLGILVLAHSFQIG